MSRRWVALATLSATFLALHPSPSWCESASESESASSEGSARDATPEPPASRRVVELPEEVVRAGELRFGRFGETKISLPSAEARRLPGGFADPTRYLQMLPGVANDSDFDGMLFVRGGEGDHNRILLDQVSVSDPYHFGGVVSFLNTDVIDRIEFVPGGYAADYGDALGGLLRIRRRIGNLNEFRTSGSITLTTANATLEGPMGEGGRGSWLVAGRRSYLDRVLSSRSVGQAALPYFFDIDSRIYRRLGGHDLRLGFLRSGDALSARLSDTFTFAPADSGGLSWDRTLSMATLNWEHEPEAWKLSQTLAYGWRDQRLELHGTLPQRASGHTRTFDWRGDATTRYGGIEWSSGAQLVHSHTEYDLDVNRLTLEQPDRRSSPRSPLDTVRTVSRFEGRDVYSALYAQGRHGFFDGAVNALFGIRVEHSSTSRQTEPTPRLRLEWRTPWRVTLSGAAGSYRQFPGHRLESDPAIGNPDLLAERARHLTLGAAVPLAHGGRLSVEGYHKKLNELITLDPEAEVGALRFRNSGSGVARGVEFLLHLPRDRWSGWLSYTLGDVRYRDALGEPEYAPAQDLRHVISAVGRVRPLPGWSLGLKWRAQSGRPYTPLLGRANVSEFVEGVEWIPVEGGFNSARFPWYHRLDVRAEREFRIGEARASAFLEVINAYGRANLFDYRYVDGFSRAVPVRMLPWLPTFGLSVSL